MNKYEEVLLHLEKPVHGGDCLAFSEGCTYFVRYGIPGETVKAKVVKRQKRIAFAQVCAVVEASKYRQESIWLESGYGGVGGAELAHVNLAYQRDWKRQVLVETISRIGGAVFAEQLESQSELFCGLAEDNASQGLGWRSRVDFQVSINGKPEMSGYRLNERYEISSMPLAVPEIAATNIFPHPEKFAELLTPGARVRVWNSAEGVRICVGQKIFDGTGQSVPQHYIRQTVTGLGDFTVPAWGFWQPHYRAPETLTDRVRKLVPSGSGNVLELYAGVGVFTKVLREIIDSSSQLVSYEGYDPAVKIAQQKLGKIGFDVRAAFIDENTISRIVDEVKRLRPETVLMDPPRSGAGRQVMEQLAQLQAERIIYIACDIASLARDGAVLLKQGYHLKYLQGLDLFPNTHHFETVALFTRGD